MYLSLSSSLRELREKFANQTQPNRAVYLFYFPSRAKYVIHSQTNKTRIQIKTDFNITVAHV